MSPSVNHRAIVHVLSGGGSYDSLSESEQAIVRQEWEERMTALRGALNYEVAFAASGESYSEVDDDGNLVVHPAD